MFYVPVNPFSCLDNFLSSWVKAVLTEDKQPYRPVESRIPRSIAALHSTVQVASKTSEIGITPVVKCLAQGNTVLPARIDPAALLAQVL